VSRDPSPRTRSRCTLAGDTKRRSCNLVHSMRWHPPRCDGSVAESVSAGPYGNNCTEWKCVTYDGIQPAGVEIRGKHGRV